MSLSPSDYLCMERKLAVSLGKEGESVRKVHEESGAHINNSGGNCPERIITLAGPTNAIFKAFVMIIDKLEEDISSSMTNSTAASRPPVTLRLVVPAALIGKGGCKIKEIGESTGAQVQVAGEMLPSSTEQAITLAGIPQSITEGVKQICVVMLETLSQYPPPKVPNDLIGCIIGCQGAKINEICQISGVQIKIGNPVERSTDKQVTITGSAASISLAQYLINVRLSSETGFYNQFEKIGDHEEHSKKNTEEICNAWVDQKGAREIKLVKGILFKLQSQTGIPMAMYRVYILDSLPKQGNSKQAMSQRKSAKDRCMDEETHKDRC
eukprot:bmy_09165T0